MNATLNLNLRTEQIPIRSGLSYQEFSSEFLFPMKPVVLADGLKDWPALQKWTPAFFKERYQGSGKNVTVSGRDYSVDEFVNLVEKSSVESPAPYLHSQELRKVFPELLEDALPRPRFCLPNWMRGPLYPRTGQYQDILIGGTGGGFPVLHYDAHSVHAFLGQVYGEKEAVLFAPSDSEYLYPKRINRHHSSITDVENPNLQQFPLFVRAIAYRGVLKPGNLLFIPSRWWHTTRMLSSSISVLDSVANRSCWHLVTDEVLHKARTKAPILEKTMLLYMRLQGWAQSLWDIFTL